MTYREKIETKLNAYFVKHLGIDKDTDELKQCIHYDCVNCKFYTDTNCDCMSLKVDWLKADDTNVLASLSVDDEVVISGKFDSLTCDGQYILGQDCRTVLNGKIKTIYKASDAYHILLLGGYYNNPNNCEKMFYVKIKETNCTINISRVN